MQYARLQFAVDKSTAAIHEGIAIARIEQWYLSQARKIHVRNNELKGLEQKREYD
jgi:hypothetical protein